MCAVITNAYWSVAIRFGWITQQWSREGVEKACGPYCIVKRSALMVTVKYFVLQNQFTNPGTCLTWYNLNSPDCSLTHEYSTCMLSLLHYTTTTTILSFLPLLPKRAPPLLCSNVWCIYEYVRCPIIGVGLQKYCMAPYIVDNYWYRMSLHPTLHREVFPKNCQRETHLFNTFPSTKMKMKCGLTECKAAPLSPPP